MNENNSDMDRLQGESFEERRERTRAERLADLHAKMRAAQEYGKLLLEALGAPFETVKGEELTLAETLKRLGGELQRPYVRDSALGALFGRKTLGDVRLLHAMADRESRAKADELTGGGFEAFREISKRVAEDGEKVLDALAAGDIPTNGETDKYGYPDVRPYLPSVTPDMFGEEYFDYIQPHDEEDEPMLVISAGPDVVAFSKYVHDDYILEMDSEALQHLVYRPIKGGAELVDAYGTLRAVPSCCWYVITALLESPLTRDVVSGILGIQPTRPGVRKENLVLGTSKAEQATFNPHIAEYVRAVDYDGSGHTIDTGDEEHPGQQMRLSLDLPGIAEMTRAEIIEMQLSSTERFWLSALQSIANDNPDVRRIYGRDLLDRWGWQNARQQSAAGTLESAARSIDKLTTIKVGIDVTGELQSLKSKDPEQKERKERVRAWQLKPIVFGLITLIEREGEETIRDFYIDLTVQPGESVEAALPLLEYSKAKGQLITAPARVFDFSADKKKGIDGVAQLTEEHRRAMDYIYRQISRKKNTNETILFETMFKALGIEMTKKKKSAISLKIEQCLDNWQQRGIIKGYQVKYNGRVKAGIRVIPDNLKLESSKK